jgi:hypothetical protein
MGLMEIHVNAVVNQQMIKQGFMFTWVLIGWRTIQVKPKQSTGLNISKEPQSNRKGFFVSGQVVPKKWANNSRLNINQQGGAMPPQNKQQ